MEPARAPAAPVPAAPAPVAVAPAPRREPPERAAAHPVARLATDADERKAQTVREYLQQEFPTIVIYDFHEHERDVRVFLLQDSQGSVVHQVAVAEELLAEDSEAELRAFFDRHKLARVLRQAGQAAVSVTRAGLKIERR
jgi:hypothetical protein